MSAAYGLAAKSVDLALSDKGCGSRMRGDSAMKAGKPIVHSEQTKASEEMGDERSVDYALMEMSRSYLSAPDPISYPADLYSVDIVTLQRA